MKKIIIISLLLHLASLASAQKMKQFELGHKPSIETEVIKSTLGGIQGAISRIVNTEGVIYSLVFLGSTENVDKAVKFIEAVRANYELDELVQNGDSFEAEKDGSHYKIFYGRESNKYILAFTILHIDLNNKRLAAENKIIENDF